MKIFGVTLLIGKRLTKEEKGLEEAIREKDSLLDAQRRATGILACETAINEQKSLENQRQTIRIREEIRAMNSSAVKKAEKLKKQAIEPLSLKITEPHGGEKWQMGDEREIRWISTGLVADKLALEFYRDGKFSRHIAMVDNGDGHYMWSIPKKSKNADAVFSGGINCQISIVDPGLPHIRAISEKFELIANQQPQNQRRYNNRR